MLNPPAHQQSRVTACSRNPDELNYAGKQHVNVVARLHMSRVRLSTEGKSRLK